MTPAELAGLLTALQPFDDQGALEETLGDLTVHIAVGQHDEETLRALLEQILRHPDVLNDCSVDVQKNGGSDHLFRITSRGVDPNDAAFERLGQDTAVNGPDYESRIGAHQTHDRDDALIETVIELLTDIAENTGYSIDFPLIVDKSALGAAVLDNTTLEAVQADDVHLHCWFDVANLRSWLEGHSFASYGDRFFPTDQLPVLVYFQNSGPEITGSSLFPVAQVTEALTVTQAMLHDYQAQTSRTGENTTFRGGAPIVTPALFTASSLAAVFRTATVYAVFAVFSDRVTRQGDQFELYTKHGPDALQTVLDIDETAAELSADQREALRKLYDDFREREDRETFVNFWRQSAVQQCDTITELPTAVDDIRDHYQFIEAETVEGNFDDLSDAVRDTHAFMTDITSQVADTTTALSDEMQRLVFTLLGAIIANLFLILRWGNIDMVIPFSLFVAGAILVFYFPLIDSRIEELAEMKAKGEADYTTYDDLITGFTGEAFDFSELEDRKDEYIRYADQRLDWARRNLRRIHTVVLLTGFVGVVLATTLYPPLSTQVGLAAVYGAAAGYLAIRIWTDPRAHSYYRLGSPLQRRGDNGEEDDDGQADDGEHADDHLRRNYLPVLVGVGSLILVLLNALTGLLPL